MLFGGGSLCRPGLLVAGVFYVLMTHCGGIANAAEPDVLNNDFFALRNYAQLIDFRTSAGERRSNLRKVSRPEFV